MVEWIALVLGIISIHALREEGDRVASLGRLKQRRISIHALREEGDWRNYDYWLRLFQFLSTPSVRRATAVCHVFDCPFGLFLSTPSVRRATTVAEQFWAAG